MTAMVFRIISIHPRVTQTKMGCLMVPSVRTVFRVVIQTQMVFRTISTRTTTATVFLQLRKIWVLMVIRSMMTPMVMANRITWIAMTTTTVYRRMKSWVWTLITTISLTTLTRMTVTKP